MVAPGLHIVEHRPAERGAPLVVLVHGSLDRAASFARVAKRLDDLDVVTYDRHGYHRSRSAAPPATLDDHVADLVTVIDGRRATLVGHSLGGDVAMAAAIAAPDLVAAVGAYEPPLPWLEWWPRRAATRPTRTRPPSPRPSSAVSSAIRHGSGSPRAPALSARAEGPTLLAELVALRTEDAPFDLAAVVVPLVVGRGERSLWHHRRAVDTLVEIHPDAVVIEIEGAAHGAHRTHPDAFAELVRRTVAAGR